MLEGMESTESDDGYFEALLNELTEVEDETLGSFSGF